MSQPITPEELKRLFPLGVSKSTLLKNLSKSSPPATVAPGQSLAQVFAAEAKGKKRFRQSVKPKLNKLESEYLLYRKALNLNQEIIHVQALRFELANGITYTPDFICARSGCIPIAIEVKGPHAFEDSIIKLKMAPTIYPWIRWIMVWKEQGQWQQQEALP